MIPTLATLKPLMKWKGCHTSNYRKGRIFSVHYIVVHVMDGSLFGTTTEFLMQLPQGGQKSSHYGIGWDWPNRSKVGVTTPEIFQYVKDEDTAFHAGTVSKPIAKKYVIGTNPNDWSIGIECHGTASVWHGKTLNPVLERLLVYLCVKHGLKANRDTIIGHNELQATTRANCPGRNCNLNQIVRNVAKLVEEYEQIRGTGVTSIS